MKKKNIFIISGIMALYLSTTSISSAADLDENMQVLAKNISVLQSSTDKQELISALEKMSNAVEDSMKSHPEKLSSDDKKGIEEYENVLKKLKNEITLAKGKVASGQLSELRDSVSRMNDIRVEGHKKFR